MTEHKIVIPPKEEWKPVPLEELVAAPPEKPKVEFVEIIKEPFALKDSREIAWTIISMCEIYVMLGEQLHDLLSILEKYAPEE